MATLTSGITTVAVVENDAPYRNCLRTILDGTPGFRCTGAHLSADVALPLVAGEAPDLLLLDLELPGLPGERAIPEFLRKLPGLLVVVLTCHQDPHRLFTCLEAGAVGYLVKPIDPGSLISALREVREGGAPMSGPVARLVLESFRRKGGHRRELEALSPRELEVLRGIATGSLPEEVAASLGIAGRTVQTHLRNIYDKLHVHSRAQAVARFLESASS